MNTEYIWIHIIHSWIHTWIHIWFHTCIHIWICIWILSVLSLPFLVSPNSQYFCLISYISSWKFCEYMNSYKTGFGTLLGTPEFIFFHDFISEIINFGPFSWKISFWIRKSKKIVKNIAKNIVISWKFVDEFSIEFIGAARGSAVSDRAGPCCSCSRATCLMVSRSDWQSYSTNTCHLSLITLSPG